MTPTQAISALDRQLTAHGETVAITKYADDGTPTNLSNVLAFVRPVKPEDLIEGIDQSQHKIALSPTGNSTVLPLRKGDKVILANSRYLNIEFPGPIYMADTLVRINLIATG